METAQSAVGTDVTAAPKSHRAGPAGSRPTQAAVFRFSGSNMEKVSLPSRRVYISFQTSSSLFSQIRFIVGI